MKQVRVVCPKCGATMWYKNWFSWIWHTPIHWFNKRRTKCISCGETSYIGREKK